MHDKREQTWPKSSALFHEGQRQDRGAFQSEFKATTKNSVERAKYLKLLSNPFTSLSI
jgi:hypothetical protein